MAKITKKKFFEVKTFGLVISFFVFIATLLLFSTDIYNKLNLKILDLNFYLKQGTARKTVQDGAERVEKNPELSDDIVIIGIDSNSLDKLGRWPFPRSVHGDFLTSLDRIKKQDQRENAVFLDIFFMEPDNMAPDNDMVLLNGFVENGNVFIETILTEDQSLRTALVERPELSISDVTGDWQNMDCYYGMESPLPELSAAMKGYGHANFRNDFDNVYRRQALIAKLSVPVSVMPVAELTADSAADESVYRRFGWTDTAGFEHYLKVPADEKELAAVIKKIQAGSPSGNVTLYQDYFIPSVTLALAVNQLGASFSDISVKVGESITIRTDKRELKIPVDDNCQMLINYAGAPGTFQVRSYSAYTATKPLDEPDKWPATKALGNKIVMVGAYAQGMAEDQKLTPYGLMYGVEIHANALNTILQENFIHNVPVWIDILILAVFIFMTALVVCRFFPLISFLISVLVIAVLFFVQSFVFDRCHYLFPFTPVALGIFLTFISVVLYRVINGEKDKKMIRNMFGKYVCPEFVDQMIEEGKSPELGGVDKDITVLFSDIRGFTSMSEKMTPQELVKHLNEYLTAMTDIIIDYYGTLDKYVGDEIMCFWGAPVDVADHALLACKCALKQMEVLHRMNESWPPEKRINIGIGINSGIMTVGNMGSAGRMNYTLMGDNVNLGARLEGTNKEYGTNIIISEYTYEKVKDHVVVRELDNIRVKGKNKPVVIYELLDVVGGYDKN